jgi:hypothetical protein
VFDVVIFCITNIGWKLFGIWDSSKLSALSCIHDVENLTSFINRLIVYVFQSFKFWNFRERMSWSITQRCMNHEVGRQAQNHSLKDTKKTILRMLEMVENARRESNFVFFLFLYPVEYFRDYHKFSVPPYVDTKLWNNHPRREFLKGVTYITHILSDKKLNLTPSWFQHGRNLIFLPSSLQHLSSY